MDLQSRDESVLEAVCRYFVLSRAQIQKLCFPEDQRGRITRRRLERLHIAGFIQKHNMYVVNPAYGMAMPVYYPGRLGCEYLAANRNDDRFLVVPTRLPQAQHLFHYLAVSDTAMTLDAAIGKQETVKLVRWINEFDVVNRDETDSAKHFRLFMTLRDQPKLYCAPDAAFLLDFAGHRGVFYLEQDRATTGARQLVARKTPGYEELRKRQGHRKHFPETTIDRFSVLFIAPTRGRRDLVRRQMSRRPGADLWRFASQTDLTAEAWLHEPVFFLAGQCDPAPLVRKREEVTA